jgi:hypothetical protein
MDALGTYHMRVSQAGQLDGIVVEGSLSSLAVSLELIAGPSFTCAAVLVVNAAYQTELNATENALIQTIAGLTPGGDTATYNIRTCLAGHAAGVVGPGSIVSLENLLTSDGANSGFTCAAILAINQGYQSQVNSAENALLAAIAGL